MSTLLRTKSPERHYSLAVIACLRARAPVVDTRSSALRGFSPVAPPKALLDRDRAPVRVAWIDEYHPPHHQLVVSMDPLDSFEELAELLGQVKPPTATKEDIVNSGLEVIRSSVLVEYEKIGRIALMCVDRIRFLSLLSVDNADQFDSVICLEDYGPEEDLRLLSCRHVFHREVIGTACTDGWRRAAITAPRVA
ncbi:hypothetical protein EDB83DRAFT_2312866 [Lactarius deliciosus]|nr:hypothetical protein EDB83DRAFT_2312866 [Lactarius deliciosus]